MVAFFCPPPFMKTGLASVFVGITALIQATGAITWPSGTQAGDLAIAIGYGNSAIAISGWTSIAGDIVNGSPTQSSFASKVLVSGDISSPPSVTVPSSGAFYVVVYRGGTTVTKKSTVAATTTTVSVTGFVKSSVSRLVLGIGMDRDPGLQSAPPSGFTLRATGQPTFGMIAVNDVTPTGYTDNAAVVFNLVAGSFGGRGTLLEIT